jgi:hypothetical protein
MDKRIYHYKVSRWLLFLIWGSLCLGLAIFTFAKNIRSVLDGSQGIFGYIGLPIIVIGFTSFGILSLAIPFTSKIILSREGIEFHTIAVVLKSKWANLKVGVLRDASGKSITLIPSNPEIKLRSWAQHAPWNVKEGVISLGIPISQYGGFSSSQVVEDIKRFAPNSGL